MRLRRTIRKPTRWTPAEWARVEDAARTRGVPPLRFVREAALGAPPAPAPQRARRAKWPPRGHLRIQQRSVTEDSRTATEETEGTEEEMNPSVSSAPSV